MGGRDRGISAMVGNSRKITLPCLSPCQAWRRHSFILSRGTNGSIETPVTSQLTHTLPIVPFRNGHGNCRFTSKIVPMAEKDGGCYTLHVRDMGTFFRPESPCYIYIYGLSIVLIQLRVGFFPEEFSNISKRLD